MVIVFVGFNPGKECVAAQMVVEHRDLVEELDFLCEAGYYFKIAFLIRDVTYLYTAILTPVPTQSNMTRYAGP